MKFLSLKGTTYSILGLYGGHIYLGNPFDVNNEIVQEGVVWEMQPFNEGLLKITVKYFTVIRFFKTDIFGQSKFKNMLSRINIF